ncbi:MAG: hypothetical protein ACOYBG_04635 [Eubacteriales bacterium]|jgi:hypothetical protein
MNKGKMTVFAVLAAVLLTAAIFIVFLNTTVAGNLSPEISLPPAPSEDPTGGNDSVKIPDVPSFPVEYLDITPENVQSVIKNLRRPENYTIEIEVEYHWSSGSSKVTRRTWGAGGVVRWQQFDLTGNPTINYICTDEAIYVWEEGEKSYITYDNGEFSIDDYGQIPTYEDILGADKADIVSASYEDQNSVPCVKTVIVDRESGYTKVYWVALESGFLWNAELLEGDRTIYRMSVIPTSFSTDRPNTSIFSLPDGSNPLMSEESQQGTA